MKAQKVILDLTALIVFGDGRWMGCLKIIRKIENVDSLKLYISMKYKHYYYRLLHLHAKILHRQS